mgnify:CR=1 FL=1
MRIWFKMMKDNHLLRDTTITDESDDTRTHKIFRAIDEVCYAFDLGKPIWLDVNVAEFKRHAKINGRSWMEEMHAFEED